MKTFNLIITSLVVGALVSLTACTDSKNFTKDQIPQIKEDVRILAADSMGGRLVGSEGEKMAYEYISKRFKELNLEGINESDSYLQEFSKKPRPNPHSMIKDTATIVGNNIVGFLDNEAEKTVVIGAHYDHLGYGEYGGSLFASSEKEVHNGADDNASGIAAMLAVAERVQHKELNNYNYLFLGFSGEEQGLWGSNYYAKNPTVPIENIAYMINMDMVGRLDEERRIAIHGTGTAPVWNQLIDSVLVSDFKIKKHESGSGPSDHTSFYLQDLPVLHFFTGQHKDYHKPSDDAELLNYEGLENVVDYIEGLLTEMNERPAPQFTKTKDESRSAPAFKVTLGVVPDYLFSEKGMRIDGVNEGGAAYNAKLQKGDIVTQMGDLEIVDMMSYMKALSVFERGQTIKITVQRNGESVTTDLTF